MTNGNSGDVYNIGSEFELENIEIVKKILQIMNKPDSMIKYVNDRPANDLRYSMDSSKLNKLGFKPEVDITTGLNKTIEWYKNNKSWWKNYLNNIDLYNKFTN